MSAMHQLLHKMRKGDRFILFSLLIQQDNKIRCTQIFNQLYLLQRLYPVNVLYAFWAWEFHYFELKKMI